MTTLSVDGQTSIDSVSLDDASELFAVVDANRVHLRRWLPWVDANRDVEYTRNFAREAIGQAEAGVGHHFLLRHAGAICGVLGFNRIDAANRLGEVGYWLAEGSQGRGLMTRSVAALLAHGFGPMNLHRISIHAASENLRSRAIPVRLGFTCEGTLRQAEWLYDHYVDLDVYSLLRPEWEDSR